MNTDGMYGSLVTPRLPVPPAVTDEVKPGTVPPKAPDLAGPLQKISVVIDPQSPGRIFEGLGAVNGGGPTSLLIEYPEPYRSDILDFLFKPKFGAGFQHLKVEIGSGMNSTCEALPSHAMTPEEAQHPVARGSTLWVASEARKRNPDIVLDALPWATPYWTTNYFTKEAADWAVAFLDLAKKQYGLTFQYIGGCQNEYTNLLKGPASEANRTFIMEYLRPALDRGGYKDVQIMSSDFYNFRTKGELSWSVMKDILKDPSYFKTVDVVAYHYPVGFQTSFLDERPLPKGFLESGKRFWASEDFAVCGGAFVSGWDYLGKVLREYNELRITKSLAWPAFYSLPEGFRYPKAGFLNAPDCRGGHYSVMPTLWCVAHITQFVQPGWKYLDHAQGRFKEDSPYGVCAVLSAPNGKDWSLIGVTESAVSLKIRLNPVLSASPVHVWKSDAREQFQQLQTVQPVHGVLTIDLDPQSIYTLTTTTGQCKGEPAHPIPAVSPVRPWKDDFRDYKVHDKPRCWVDQEGTFEIAQVGGANVVKQVVPKIGYHWGNTLGGCISLFGGNKPMHCFGMRVECLIQNGYFEVGAALPHGIKAEGLIQDGYIEVGAALQPYFRLRLNKDGQWQLGAVAKGCVPSFQPEAWHVLSFRIDGDRKLICCIDDQQVYAEPAPFQNAALPLIGSSYHPNMFKSVEITYES